MSKWILSLFLSIAFILMGASAGEDKEDQGTSSEEKKMSFQELERKFLSEIAQFRADRGSAKDSVFSDLFAKDRSKEDLLRSLNILMKAEEGLVLRVFYNILKIKTYYKFSE